MNALRECEFVDLAERRLEIVRPSAAAADVHGELAVAELHVPGPAGFLAAVPTSNVTSLTRPGPAASEFHS